MTAEQRLMAQLDKDQPRWHFEWATHHELDRAVRMSKSILDLEPILKKMVAQRLFHRILNAALSAGIMVETD